MSGGRRANVVGDVFVGRGRVGGGGGSFLWGGDGGGRVAGH